MEFSKEKAIFLQIADALVDAILAGKWQEEQRIPSTREMAVSMEVNPNTVVRAYAYLQENEVIYNRRGIGYFVAPSARDKILAMKREHFIKTDLPRLVETMKLLGISFDELKTLYESSHDKA